MKHFLAFLKATLLGGVIVVFPAWLAVLLVLKALTHLEVFVKPISKHLPQAIGHPRILAILLLVGLCFLVGLAIHTAIGRRIERAAERVVLDKIPGYTTLHGFAARLSDSKDNASFQPALVEIEEALVPGFIVEQHSGNRSTVFIPSVPTPMTAAVYIIDNNRVHPLDLPAVSVMQCISKWGGGSDKLVAAYDAASSHAASLMNQPTNADKNQ
ncbi:MAG TPA: DUF502 domain-containing protein [Blastocatellia bacterium]|jgi:uncharacterized membrane protein